MDGAAGGEHQPRHRLGLLQFVSTGLITWLHVRHANNKLRTLATEIREDLEEPLADANCWKSRGHMTIFLAFVAVTMFIVIRASRTNKTASDCAHRRPLGYRWPRTARRSPGDYLSAASFLGITVPSR